MESFKVLGTTDEVSSCDCCGRSDLKSTVALSFDGAAPVYYGVVCAAKAVGLAVKQVRATARVADRERDVAAERARQEIWAKQSLALDLALIGALVERGIAVPYLDRQLDVFRANEALREVGVDLSALRAAAREAAA